MKQRRPKPGSVSYYIEEVIRYRTEYETGEGFKNGNPPIVAELLLSLLISVRALRSGFFLLLGALLALVLKAFILL